MTGIDQSTRDQALDIANSYAISAPAGSGKTGLLIRRVLRLLARCDEPEQLLAITFTRKAAAEMHERVVQALQNATQPQPDDEYALAIWTDARAALARDQEQNWGLLANPNRLRIMTIDSLNRYLAQQLAVDTGLGELPEPSEQPETLYKQAISALFDQLDNSDALSDALALLLEHLDNNLTNLESLLTTLLAQREQWLEPLLTSQGARQGLEQVMAQIVRDSLSQVAHGLLPVASDLISLADYAAENLSLEKSDSPIAQLKGIVALPETHPTNPAIGQWMALCNLLLTDNDQWRKPRGINKKTGFPTRKDSTRPDLADTLKTRFGDLLGWCESKTGLLEQLVNLRYLPAIGYTDRQWQLMEALARVLPRLVAQLSLVFAEQASCDFTEITLAADKALGEDGDPGQLAMVLDYRIQHILVDEFQDTSSIQFRLLKKLVAGWEPNDGRTLFIVGDPMQSLYGFRNANVGLFLEARRTGVNALETIALDLKANFRSSPGIVDWVNRTFAHVFPNHEDISRGAVPYSTAVAARSSLADSGVTLDIFEAPAEPDNEAAVVVARVQQALALDPGGSIAILTRARSHLQSILPALMAAGIPWVATDIDPLASRMPVMDLHSLTRAFINPSDRTAWLSILRAPWCGLDSHDLHKLANPEDVIAGNYPWLPPRTWTADCIQSLSQPGQQILARVGPLLRQAWHKRQRAPLRNLIEGLWLALGGPATLLNSNELDWCQQYLDLLEQQEMGGELTDFAAFESAIERLYAAPDTTAKNPVRIMTIHKAKGLEFDTVIVPGLDRRSGNHEAALLYWRERVGHDGDSQLLIAPPLSPREQAEKAATSQLVRHLRYESKLESQLEDARVLYVACTRAIKRLHLLFTDNGQTPPSGSLLSRLWPAFADGFEYAGAVVTHHHSTAQKEDDKGEEELPVHSQLMRLKPDWKPPLQNKNLAGNNPSNLSPDRQQADDKGRHTGTVLHRTLRQIVMDGLENWNADRIQRQRPAWHIQLRALGLTDTTVQLELLAKAIANVLNDTNGRWLLQPHQNSHSEWPVSHLDENDQAITSVIDRVFVDNGTLWIIDYKTATPHERQPVETFLQQQQALYGDQLKRYRRAMSQTHSGEITTALYFPLLPKLFVID